MEIPNHPLPAGAIDRILGVRRAPMLAFDLIHGLNVQSTMVLTWHHGLMDAYGAELLLRLIDSSVSQNVPPNREVFDTRQILFDTPPSGWSQLANRGRFARKSLFLIDEVCRPPIASIGLKSPGSVKSNMYRRIRFTEEETSRIDSACECAGAGFRRSLYFLAAAIRAFHRVRMASGNSGGSYVVPMPLDCRKRCSKGPLLSNPVSFLFFRVEPGQLQSMPNLIRSLSQQMMDLMRCEAPASFATALDFFRRIPLAMYSRILGGPTGGKMASFYFSDIGLSLHEIETFLGRRILDITHLAPVTIPPGLGIITSRFRERLSVILSWVAGCLSPNEQDLMAESLSHDLLTGGIE
jgi:hypothetical protein